MSTIIARAETINGIEFFNVGWDGNGNRRYIVHYSSIPISDEEREQSVYNHYQIALKKARSIGGKKYTAKWFVGGIVFQSDNLNELADLISKL